MPGLTEIAAQVRDGARLSDDDALSLLRSHDLVAIGRLADLVRRRRHPPLAGGDGRGEVTYIVDRNINYTNVCVTLCKFCAFYRRPGDPEGYDHPIEVILEKIRETKALGGVQILLQGGHNPDYGIERYEELFRAIKEREPIHIHGLSPSEILHLSLIHI